jgi:hypothetical protein
VAADPRTLRADDHFSGRLREEFAGDPPRPVAPGAEAVALARRRLEQYAARWERSSAKLRRGEYHSEDLVEDCFTLWGNALRDATAVATLAWRASAMPMARRGRPPSAPR